MTRRWRSLLMLWLALCLPLQGFAAASGLWCAQMGFHAPVWAVAGGGHGAHAAHGMRTAHVANAAGPADHASAPPAAGLGDAAATTALPCHATSPAVSATRIADTISVPSWPGAAEAPSFTTAPHAAEVTPSAPAVTACAHCAGCHATAVLLPTAAPVAADAGNTAPAAWAPTPHHGPWPQGPERPPRTLLA
jgi:hypothetical protein